jgi:hypothetical protein
VKEKRKNYLLRMDEALWDDLNRWASQEFRSVNGQIELVLNRAVEERRRHGPRQDNPDQDMLPEPEAQRQVNP